MAVWGGGGMLNCAVDHNLQEFYTLFLTRFRTYKIASSTQTKKTSKDDIKGLVSIKFLRLCEGGMQPVQPLSPRALWAPSNKAIPAVSVHKEEITF